MLVVLVVLAFGACLFTAFVRPAPARAATPACTISATLVNSCRPWLGAESGGYGASALKARMTEHEARIGRPLDIVHAYFGAGAVLSPDVKSLAARPSTIALVNWRVSLDWTQADGSNADVNAQIDAMAASIKSLGTSRIMLTLYHEPEVGISPGGSPSCPTTTLKGTAGTTADYVDMWHNVRARFDALGVNNVVWVMNYLGYVTYNCVALDPYPKNTSWTAVVSSFYNYLTNHSDAQHDFLSKPWGLAEFGYVGSSQPAGYAMYDEALRDLQNNVFPKLKAYVVWDNHTSTSHDDRVGYDENHVSDPVEQQHYDAFANDPALTGAAEPEPTDHTPPTATLSSPGDGTEVDGTVTASDDVSVDSVDLLVDGEVADASAPGNDGSVSFDWDTGLVPDGTHTVQLRAHDTAGNTGLSGQVSVTVQNGDEEPPVAPDTLTGTWSSPSKVTLAWSAASDDTAVTAYDVYRDGDPIATLPGTARGYVDTGVDNLATHTYTVTALDAAGHESLPSVGAVVQNGDDTAPTTPDPAATLTAPDEATISWGGSSDNADVTGYRVYRNGSLLADVDDEHTSLVDGDLDEVTTYTYRVSAYDAAGNVSDLSDPVGVTTPDRTAPSTPSNLSAVSSSQGVALTWGGSSDNVAVTGYRIFRDGLPLIVRASTARSYTDSALVGNTLHRYQVTALDAAGNESQQSNEVARTLDTTAPTVPSSLSAVSTSQSVALTWGASSDNWGVTSYVVYRDGLPLMTLAGTATSYTDRALVGSTLHRYQVTARDAAGNESQQSNTVARTLPDTTAPTAPTRLAGSLSGFTVRLSWTASTDNVGVTGYTIYRGGVAIGTSTTPSYADSAAPLGKVASYTVRARDAAGNLGALSSTVKVTVPADKTAPTAPGGLKATAGSKQVTLTWTASSDNVGVVSYYVYRGNAKYKLLGKVLTYADTGLKTGTRYTYKIYALDAAGNRSSPTATVSATAK
jgi:fibronectin type 3 domain-containing protein